MSSISGDSTRGIRMVPDLDEMDDTDECSFQHVENIVGLGSEQTNIDNEELKNKGKGVANPSSSGVPIGYGSLDIDQMVSPSFKTVVFR